MTSRYNAVDLTHDSSSEDEGRRRARGRQAAPRPGQAARARSAPRLHSGAVLINQQQGGSSNDKRPRLSGASAGPSHLARSTGGVTAVDRDGRVEVLLCDSSGDSDVEDISAEEFRLSVFGPVRAVETGGAAAEAAGTAAASGSGPLAAAAAAFAHVAAAGAGPEDADEVLITATVGQVRRGELRQEARAACVGPG